MIDRCSKCKGALLPEWGRYRYCPTCRERNARRMKARRASRDGRALNAKHQRDYRDRNRADVNASRMDKYAAKSEQRQCVNCTQPTDGETKWCAKHRESHRLSQEKWHQKRTISRRRASESTPAKVPASPRKSNNAILTQSTAMGPNGPTGRAA